MWYKQTFCDWFLSLAWCFPGSFTLWHVSVLQSFLWQDDTPLFHLSVGRHLGCSAIKNNAVMNIHVQVLMGIYVFLSLGLHPGVEFWAYMVTTFNILGTSQLVCKEAAPFYNPPSNVWGSPFLHVLTNIVCLFVSCCRVTFYLTMVGRSTVCVGFLLNSLK